MRWFSRAVASLETHLGTRLINRTTREMSLTDAGARYLEGCRAVLEELHQLESTIRSTEAGPSGTLRVVASSALSPLTLTQLVAGFCKCYRSVTVRLTLVEVEGDFGHGGYGVGVVTGVTDSVALKMRSLGAISLVPVATPAFVAEHGLPVTPTDLQRMIASVDPCR
jgi:DNA-binding transcriptional LysR family regulator